MNKQEIINQYFDEIDDAELLYETGENTDVSNRHYFYSRGGLVEKFKEYYITRIGQIGYGFTDFCNIDVYENKNEAIDWVKSNECEK